MLLILYVLALALAVSGAWALAWGIPMIVLERGWTWVISGSMYLTGAAIVFALAMVVRTLKQLPDLLEAGILEEPGEPRKAEAADAASPAPVVPTVAPQVRRLPQAPPGEPAAPQPTTTAPVAPVAPSPAATPTPAVTTPVAALTAGAPQAAPTPQPSQPPAAVAVPPPAAPVSAPVAAKPAPSGFSPASAARPELPTTPAPVGTGVRVGEIGARPAEPASASGIPAAVEGRLNDLLRPGALTGARPAQPAADAEAPLPATTAPPAQPTGKTLGDLARPEAPRPDLTRPLPRANPRPVTEALDAPSTTPPTPGRGAEARPGSGLAAAATAPVVRTPAPTTAPQSASGATEAGKAIGKVDLAARIGSMFGRRAGKAGDASDGNDVRQSAAAAASPRQPVFPERPAPRPMSASALVGVGPGLPGIGELASSATTPAPALSAALASAPARPVSAPASVVFPERPAPRAAGGLTGAAPAATTTPTPAPTTVTPAQGEEKAENAPSGPPGVVGSYTAGGVHYVMYADGSIDAQTPDGVLHFDSLDALKAHMGGGRNQGA